MVGSKHLFNFVESRPDVEEGEKFIRRHNQSKCADQSLFLNFSMHSARVEACDCPPTNHVPSQEQSNSFVLPGRNTTHIMGKSDSVVQDEGLNSCSEYPQVKQDGLLWESMKNKRRKGHHPFKKVSQACEMPRCSMQESEKHGRDSNDEFLRVLFWQFHNFRMLLGSDLMLFSNEKYVAVTPLTWLDNVMASVPELAICYHENGVVQGYELLKTDDIFLSKGISEDGTPAFHPYVVQQNGLSVLRFLQENCKEDPGAYWLYKSAGEDVIQLFDLSVIPKNHSSNDCDDASSSLPTVLHTRSDSLYSLGTLLYRIAHRLSLSMAPNKRARCVRFLRKCLDFLDEPDHLIVRAFAHEQFARLVLNYDEKLDLTSESLPLESKVTGTDAKEESLDFVSGLSESIVHEKVFSSVAGNKPYEDEQSFQDLVSEASVKLTLEENLPDSRNLIASRDPGRAAPSISGNESFAVCKVSPTTVHTVADPISSKLAAVHHVSQAISSLRRMRQLQSTKLELEEVIETNDKLPSSIHFSVCACGDADCIEVYNIREWLPTLKLDHKLWKLVLLLGESYLALGQAYKEDGQLHQALKVVELTCSIYGSMPQHLEDTRFISSMINCSSRQKKFIERNESTRTYSVGEKNDISNSADDSQTFELSSSTYLFWAKAWTLVGDVYVELHMINGKEISIQARRKSSNRQLRMSSEVAMEVERLKKKLGQHNQNCSSCSLVNCSFQSDRASSGSSASSSNADMHSVAYGKKQTKKSHAKSISYSLLGNPENDQMHNGKNSGIECLQHTKGDKSLKEASYTNGVQPLGTNSKKVEGFLEMHDVGSTVASQTETAPKEAPDVKIGSIFKYLGGPLVKDAEHNLLASLSCYEEARKALGGLPSGSTELQFVFKKKGWVCNELGRNRLARKELNIAEDAFAEAINAFRVVSDHTNIILINCNLGHGRRSLAEEMVSNIENLKIHAIFRNAYNQASGTAKLEYSESLRYYGAAKSELNFITEEADSVTSSLRNEVYTQFANTYLRLGMLLAKEDETAKVYENGAMEDTRVGFNNERKGRKELRKHEISANDAIREPLCVYESLGELHKQEAAYAYFQLACYQRDCCLKFLESDHKKNNLSKGENSILQRVKQYASLAERNWQRAMEFYGPVTHPSSDTSQHVRDYSHGEISSYLKPFRPFTLTCKFEVTVTSAEEESLEFVSSMSESDVHEKVSSSASGDKPYEDGQNFQDLAPEGSEKMTLEENLSASQELIAAGDEELRDPGGAASSSSGNESSVSPASVQTVADPIPSILAEVHRVCQDIISYILGRQLRSTKQELQGGTGTTDELPSSTNSSVCACGGADCIEARNIREWLQTSKWDNVLQKLVLTLGVTCLGLSHAYKDNGELLQALKVIESACYICGSMPQHLEDTKFISPMVSESNEKTIPYSVGAKDDKSSSADDSLTFGKSYSTEIFWSTAWMLVGDVYIQFKNFSSCSLEDCVCLSDRTSSGSGTSTSGPLDAKTCPEACERKQRKILHAKGSPYSLLGDPEDDSVHHQMHGIFKYLQGPFVKNEVYNYSDALSCYGEARKALVGFPSDSAKLQLLVNKEKWVRDALEEIRLSREALSQSINWLLHDDTNNA